MSYHHRSSSLKQSNKKHKTGRDTSKRRVDRRDNVGGRTGNVRKVGKFAKSTLGATGRVNRANHAKQTAANKKAAVLRNKRFGPGGAYGPPRFVAIVSLHKAQTSARSLHDNIVSLMTRKSTNSSAGDFIQTTGVAEKWNTRLTVSVTPESGDDDTDISALLDVCKVADLVLVVVPATLDPDEIVDGFGERALTAMRAQSTPSILGIVQGMENIKNPKRHTNAKKLLQRFFDTEFGDGTKVLEDYSKLLAQSTEDVEMDVWLSGSSTSGKSKITSQDRKSVATKQGLAIDQVYRFVSSLKLKDLAYRSMRPYLVADKATVEEGSSSELANVHVTGFIRGKPLGVNQLVHITGVGTYRMESILHALDPCPARIERRGGNSEFIADAGKPILFADESMQESLQSWAEINPLAGEQTVFSDTELEEAGFDTSMGGTNVGPSDFVQLKSSGESSSAKKKKKKKDRFPGQSETQKAWLEVVESEESEDDDGHDVDEGSEEEEMAVDNEDEDEDADRYALELRRWREKRAELREQQDQDVIFPDEVDTPENIPARERFARYRGLKSFRSSPWDPKESLPLDYARIFQIENIAYTQKRLLEQSEARHRASIGKSMAALLDARKRAAGKKKASTTGMEVENSGMGQDIEMDNDDLVADCVPVGQYVTLVVKDVNRQELLKHKTNNPLVLSGLFLHENRMSVVHFNVRKSSSFEGVVKSKDAMEIHCGFRRSICKPLFSENNYNCDKHKFERFLQPNRFVAMTAYLPITYSPAPVLAFKKNVTSSYLKKKDLALSGSLMSINPDRIVLKRILLSGTPVKVKKKTATVRFMFFNPDDIRWFKPLELWTKHGISGHIRQPIGTHGSMKCVFNGAIKQHDTVCMSLYKRVYPKTVEETEI
jgi:pre-rRNA-processing protein TSR1